MARLLKITVSVPADLVDGLDYVSDRLGVSRSSVVAQLLSAPVASIVAVLRNDLQHWQASTDDLRSRGRSELLIRQRLENAQRLVGDLLSEEAG